MRIKNIIKIYFIIIIKKNSFKKKLLYNINNYYYNKVSSLNIKYGNSSQRQAILRCLYILYILPPSPLYLLLKRPSTQRQAPVSLKPASRITNNHYCYKNKSSHHNPPRALQSINRKKSTRILMNLVRISKSIMI